MQTFMPMIGFRQSLEELDDSRLNKQVQECSSIIDIIMDESKGYQDHPAVTMWRENVLSLCNYGAIAAKVHSDRRGTALDRQAWFAYRQADLRRDMPTDWVVENSLTPPFIGDLWFHRSHRSNLIRKDPMFYDEWPSTPEDMPYLWPRVTGTDSYKLYVSVADYGRLEKGERVLPEQLTIDLNREVKVSVDAV